MSAPVSKKKYGLIKPKQARLTNLSFLPRTSVFGDDSSSEEELQSGAAWDRKAVQRATEQSVQKKQTKLDMQRALEQDPTIYEYDQVYDEMAEKRSETKRAKQDVDRKPKYIASLLAQSERRKREYERRTERMVQKEREAEGEQFKDKEAFVTASYRAKLEEFSKQDEEEEYRDKLEAFTEVSKQQDLSGFYRHIFRQTVADQEPAPPPPEPPAEHATTAAPPAVEASTPAEELSPAAVVSSPAAEEATSVAKASGEKRKRQYRPRQVTGDDSDSALSDSSSSSSDSSDSVKRVKSEPSDSAVQAPAEVKVEESTVVESVQEVVKKCESEPVEKEVVEEKPKINIWLKRTVGQAFDSALHRYYLRKGAN